MSPGAAEWEFISDFDWNKMANQRCNFTIEWLQEAQVSCKLIVYAITISALRYLNAWTLNQTDSYCGQGALLDLCTTKYSPYCHCMQYLRSVVSVDNPRFTALAFFAGFRIRSEFINSEHPTNLTCRSAVLATSAWNYWRSLKYKHGWHSLVPLTDDRLTEEEQSQSATRFYGKKPCCHDPGCGRKVRKRLTKASDLFNKRNKRFSRSLRKVPVENGRVESLHARGQRHNAVTTSWAMFSGDFVNSQAKCHSRKFAELRDDAFRALAPPPSPSPPSSAALMNNIDVNDDDEDESLGAGTNPKLILQQRMLKEAKARKEKLPPMPEFWKRVDAKLNDIMRNKPDEFRELQRIGDHNASKKRKTTAKSTTKPVWDETEGPERVKVAIENLCYSTQSSSRPPALALMCEPCGGDNSSSSSSSSAADPGHKVAAVVPPGGQIPVLKSTSICPRCQLPGSKHRVQTQHLETWLRVQPDAAETLLENGDAGLSETPISASRFAVEKYRHGGGLQQMTTKFTDSVCRIGRDLGKVPEHQAPLRNCPPNLCLNGALSPDGYSLRTQLLATFTDIVTDFGGPSKVALSMPREA